MKLEEQIYKMRSAKGLSQGELAEMLEVSRQSVSKWETGASVPELDKLVKMSALFGVTLDELVTGEAPAAPPAPAAPRGALNRTVAVILFALAGVSLLVTVLFTNPLGIHLHEGLSLAALFALLGFAVMFPRENRVFRLCLYIYGTIAVILFVSGPWFIATLPFTLAYLLVLAVWYCLLGTPAP